MSEQYYSRVVYNAFIDKDLLIKNFPEFPANSDQQPIASVFQVVMGDKKFICCTAGGKITSSQKSSGLKMINSSDQIALSALGKITIDVAGKFVSHQSRLIIQEINCELGNNSIKTRISEGMSYANDGDLLVFIGDMAGSCDGRILPLLNYNGEKIELPNLRDTPQSKTENELPKLSTAEIQKRAKNAPQVPAKKVTSSQGYERNIYVAELARRRAKGVCQLCNNPAPFNDKKGEPFLEVHHVLWLSKGGNDTIENTVALCPNCHRKMHVVNSEKDFEHLQSQALQAID